MGSDSCSAPRASPAIRVHIGLGQGLAEDARVDNDDTDACFRYAIAKVSVFDTFGVEGPQEDDRGVARYRVARRGG